MSGPVEPLLNQHSQHLPDDVPASATHRPRTQSPMPVCPNANHKIISGHGVAAVPLHSTDTQVQHHVGRQLYLTDGRRLGSKTLATRRHRLQPEDLFNELAYQLRLTSKHIAQFGVACQLE